MQGGCEYLRHTCEEQTGWLYRELERGHNWDPKWLLYQNGKEKRGCSPTKLETLLTAVLSICVGTAADPILGWGALVI